MQLFNASAVANVSRLAYNPSLCLPHLAVSSFDKIPVPVEIPGKNTEIRGLVIDKDNCFAQDHDDKLWPAYQPVWTALLAHYRKEHMLIVSNSAGTNDDVGYAQALKLEEDLGVTVLRHPTKKPGCHGEIMDYFRQNGILDPAQIAVIGDRLMTDMLMANMMGSWGIWLSEGVELSNKPLVRLERYLYESMAQRENPYLPPIPKSDANA